LNPKKISNLKAVTDSSGRCPVCLSTDLQIILEFRETPVHCGLLLSEREQALRVAKGDISLALCNTCTHIFNLVFDPELMQYGEPYDNSLHFSPIFQSYIDALIERLVKQYRLYGKDIIEIGSGRGDFIKQLCERGNSRGLGFDPGFELNENNGDNSGEVRLIKDYFSEQYAAYPADLICCRQTLEHINQPREFIQMIRRSIGDRLETILFLEVPNFLPALREGKVWTIIYEHYSYFNKTSLAHLLNDCGFEVIRLDEGFEDQFLSIEAKPVDGSNSYVQETSPSFRMKFHDLANKFAEGYLADASTWKEVLSKAFASDEKVVIWGAGARCMSFLNMLQIKNEIRYVVDINPRKHGMFIAGTGQQIVPVEFLSDYRPDRVLLMNPIYKNEIEATINGFGLEVNIQCV
jgi:hypothetical protein